MTSRRHPPEVRAEARQLARSHGLAYASQATDVPAGTIAQWVRHGLTPAELEARQLEAPGRRPGRLYSPRELLARHWETPPGASR